MTGTKCLQLQLQTCTAETTIAEFVWKPHINVVEAAVEGSNSEADDPLTGRALDHGSSRAAASLPPELLLKPCLRR